MKLKLASLALLSAMFLTACSSNHNSSASEPSTHTSHTSKTTSVKKSSSIATSESQTSTNKIKLSQQEAIDKFHNQFNGKKIHSIDLKLEGSQYVYEIDGFDDTNEYSAEINAETGHASSVHSEKLDHDDDDEKQELNLNGAISRDEASVIAEQHAKGTAHEWSLEQDHGKTYWDVEVGGKHYSSEVKIDAHSKKVVSTEHDD